MQGPPPTLRLKSLSMFGHLQVSFSQNLSIPNNLAKINEEVIKLEVIPSLAQDEENYDENERIKIDYGLKWSVEKFD